MKEADDLLNKRNYQEALESYDKALAINPKDAAAWNNRGYALDKLGKYQEALESFDKALAINPKDAGAWYIRGMALHEISELALDELKELDPSLFLKYREEIEKAKSSLARGRYDEAEKQALRIRVELKEAKKRVKQAREDLDSARLALEEAK